MDGEVLTTKLPLPEPPVTYARTIGRASSQNCSDDRLRRLNARLVRVEVRPRGGAGEFTESQEIT